MNAAVGNLIKGRPARARARSAGPEPMTAILLRLGGGLLFAGALALFFLAFTQFDAAPQPGSPGFTGHEERTMRDAQVSVLLGVAGCFVLLGAFACFSRAQASATRPPAHGPRHPQGPSGPPGPRP
jgi:hypothetical protein